jgi:hypothetical protein
MPLAPAEFPEYTTASDRKRARIGWILHRTTQ